MEPDEVAMIYWKQAKALELFVKALNEHEYSAEELKKVINIVAQKYCELLYNLAKFTPTLQSYDIKFYKLNSLDEPPFDKEFFSKKL